MNFPSISPKFRDSTSTFGFWLPNPCAQSRLIRGTEAPFSDPPPPSHSLPKSGLAAQKVRKYDTEMKQLLRISSILSTGVGIVLICGGSWGIVFTYQNVAQEKMVTSDDATIPGAPVRGPLTLKAQADIIRTHMLRTSEGRTFAEMPRQIPRLDENGKPILGSNGKPVMQTNAARDLWVTVTALRTALHLGIVTYAFSGLTVALGLMLMVNGMVFFALSRR